MHIAMDACEVEQPIEEDPDDLLGGTVGTCAAEPTLAATPCDSPASAREPPKPPGVDMPTTMGPFACMAGILIAPIASSSLQTWRQPSIPLMLKRRGQESWSMAEALHAKLGPLPQKE